MGHGAMWCLMLMALYMLSLVIEASIVVLLKVAPRKQKWRKTLETFSRKK